MDLVALSPHLDDAVFSCGGLIGAAVARGERALVVTFGTRLPGARGASGRMLVFSDYQTRLAEDKRALDILGAEQRALGFVERVFRAGSRVNPFRTPDGIEGFDMLDDMQGAVGDLPDEFSEAVFYVPLGIGNHFDHVEVFLASLRAAMACGALDGMRFYEDIYSVSRRIRRQHPVARRQSFVADEAPDRTSWRLWVISHILAMARRGPSIESYLPGGGRHRQPGLLTHPVQSSTSLGRRRTRVEDSRGGSRPGRRH